MSIAIIIPARWGSTRLPGKPLAVIAGRTMLARVTGLARAAAQMTGNEVRIAVATDDARIAAHCAELNTACIMTGDCMTGTDRVLAASLTPEMMNPIPQFIINLQGDAALTPPDFITALIASWRNQPAAMLTPVARLSWEELDRLRETKKNTPHSGTFAVFNQVTGLAYWFSKSEIPAMRNEKNLRASGTLSPLWRHIGIYGYSREMLQTQWPKMTSGAYEQLEGLEQLRVLEHGGQIRCVPVDYRGRANMSGIDSPEDIARAEALIAAHGELLP